MRSGLVVFTLLCLLLPLSAENLPTCNRHAFTRRGNRISITTQSLSRLINQRLTAVHSDFKNVVVTPSKDGGLNITGQKDGKSVSIDGPVDVTSDGVVRIHAKHIKKNGNGEKNMMSLFGKTLSDYLKPKARSVDVQGNDLLIHPDDLLGVGADLRQLRIDGSTIELLFAEPPCR
ncbi:MAG: hypothetical protein ROO76_16690 [Terriglobia bacterium]|nr:hypothetical protein [Terriglobia bacterium]